MATSQQVKVLRRSTDGSYAVGWSRTDIGDAINAAVVLNNHVVVSDKTKQTLTVLSLADGKTETSLGAADIKGGLDPVCLAAWQRWLFVADEKGKRIVRFKIVDENAGQR